MGHQLWKAQGQVPGRVQEEMQQPHGEGEGGEKEEEDLQQLQ